MAVQLLSQATGYGIIVGLSVLFCIIILAAVRVQKRYLSEDSVQSEMFMVANRSVGTGLTASAVFSSWMWINESVFSAAYAYKWGVALPIWWASGLSFQIALMAFLGIVAKLRVPHAHTSLEIMRQRYGKHVHAIFIVMNLVNNIFGCGSMILAGSQLVTGMTGMHVVAAAILIPLGVVLYTAVGGLKATFLTDYLHTTIALILLTYFSISVVIHEKIGGFSGLYDKVMATEDYIDGNYEGSLLSAKSENAILFGVVLKYGNLALVLMDTAFWQKSFAAEVKATVPGYNLASVVIIAIPWCTGTIMGLSARAIEKTTDWITYPQTLSATQVNSGLVMPYLLKSLLGTGATAGLLVLIFMAITSTVSSSMIAVSSIISIDLYRTYINPKASDRKILKVSHLGVVFHGAFMAGFAIMLEYAGATNNWSTYFRPVVACPGILPLALALLWDRQTKAGAILAPILGLLSAMAVWLGLSYKWGGAINIDTTQLQMPGLYAATVAFFSPALYSVIISLLWPSKFDWREFLRIDLIEDKSQPSSTTGSSLRVDAESGSIEEKYPHDNVTAQTTVDSEGETQRKEAYTSATSLPPSEFRSHSQVRQHTAHGLISQPDLDEITHPFDPSTLHSIKKWSRIAGAYFLVNVLVTAILWPLPLYRDYIFGKSFFGGWISMAIIWQWFAIVAVVVYPVWDGREAISRTLRGVREDLGWRERGQNRHEMRQTTEIRVYSV